MYVLAYRFADASVIIFVYTRNGFDHVDFISEVGPKLSILIQDGRHFQNGRHIILTYTKSHSLQFFV
jgi:hypothetical protein